MKVLTGGSSLEEGRSSNCASRPRSSWRLLSGCLRPCRVDARHCSMRALISFPMTTESLFLMEVELTELQLYFGYEHTAADRWPLPFATTLVQRERGDKHYATGKNRGRAGEGL